MIAKENQAEGLSWLLLGIIARYLQLPSEEADRLIQPGDIDGYRRLLYHTFEKWAGPLACTPNFHSLVEHVHEIRQELDGKFYFLNCLTHQFPNRPQMYHILSAVLHNLSD